LKLVVNSDAHQVKAQNYGRARHRPGTARLADERTDIVNTADVEAAREDPAETAVTDFRTDGAAALEWAARYLERVDELPVLAQVRPGELSAKLPLSAPEQAERSQRIARRRRADRAQR